MKAIVLAAVLAGAGGAGLALLAAPRSAAVPAAPAAPAVPAAPAAPDPGGALAAALASLEREVANLRAEIRGISSLRPPPAGGGGPAAPPRAPAGENVPVPGPSAAVRTVGPPGVPPESVTDRLRPLRGWHKDSDVRARWLFLGEAEALAWFGTPDRVEFDTSAEKWFYRCPTGEVSEEGFAITDDVILVLSRGRLIAVYD